MVTGPTDKQAGHRVVDVAGRSLRKELEGSEEGLLEKGGGVGFRI